MILSERMPDLPPGLCELLDKGRKYDALKEAAQKTQESMWSARHHLAVMIDKYVRLAASGDCGNWNPEIEPEVIAARAYFDGSPDPLESHNSEVAAEKAKWLKSKAP